MGYIAPVTAPARRRDLLAALAAALGCGRRALAAPATVPAAPLLAADVLVLGDSITAGFGLAPAESMPAQLQAELARRGKPVRVLAAGVFGDTAEGGLARASGLPPTAVAVVALGANDLLEGVAPARTEAALHAVVARLKGGGAHVVLAGGRSPFGRGAGFDALFARVAAGEGVALAPDILAGVSPGAGTTQADGLHPNARGAALIAARLAPAVLRALEARA